jgi:hypothetical protein
VGQKVAAAEIIVLEVYGGAKTLQSLSTLTLPTMTIGGGGGGAAIAVAPANGVMAPAVGAGAAGAGVANGNFANTLNWHDLRLGEIGPRRV